MPKYWGQHLIIDAAQGDLNLVQDVNHIAAFTKVLVEEIDMVAYGEPMIPKFANHDPAKGGASLIQFIETSNICGHFVDSNGDFYIDIFSCKEFDNEKAVRLVQEWFRPKAIAHQVLYRAAPPVE